MVKKGNKGENTRQLIIDKATILFTKNGYGQTSLSQILAATGLAKGGFYFHFKSKEELGIAVLNSLDECWTKEMLPGMLKGRNAKEKLELLFSRPGDCCCSSDGLRPTILLLNLATEMMEVNDRFSQSIQRIFEVWCRTLERVIEEGQREKVFREDVDPTAISAIILSNIIGANLLALLNHRTDIYVRQLSALRSVLFQGIAAQQPVF